MTIVMASSERRRSQRWDVAIPVELPHGTGVTRNMSAFGVCFETDQPYTKGEPITFTVLLSHVDPGQPVRMRCRGEVVRVEHLGGKVRVASTIDEHLVETRA